ncbi:hypothetical protein [Lentilitoribacter sp. Alg239-R112]|uniref:hypothetical protein n=1 Tax=Lentilitoribacter sp. Alg239-R112 TaxID=2305987 RepID=UPI0013A6A996|nr:hypothetical protein [Lentilitoribacter sp. Alg239-R112]
MRFIILTTFLLLSFLTPSLANPSAVKIILEGVSTIEAAEKLAGVVNDITEATDDAVINLINSNEFANHYSEVLRSSKFATGTGLLFDVTVLESSSSNKRYVMVPVLVGDGINANDAALRSIIGSRVVKHDTFGADITFLKNFDEIGSLPENLSVSDKSRAIWVYKTDDKKISFHVIDDSKSFWADARLKRIKMLLQKSVIKGLPEAEAVEERSRQYSELANLYREQIKNAGISGQLISLRAARSKAAADLVDAMHKLDQASGIMRSLKGVQVIQDILSVASIVNNAAASAANQAQLDQIQSDVTSLKGEMAQLQNSVVNMETRINYLETSVSNFSGQLNSLENSINQIFLEKLKLDSGVVPDPQVIINNNL